MLNVLHMDTLERSLNAYTTTTEEETIKAGLKESLFWLLLKTAEAVTAMLVRFPGFVCYLHVYFYYDKNKCSPFHFCIFATNKYTLNCLNNA